MTFQKWLCFVGIGAVLVVAGLAGSVSSQDLAVEQIVEKTNQVAYYQGKDGRAKVSMTITDSQGRSRERRFTILRWDAPSPDAAGENGNDSFCGSQKMYVYFDQPADVKKMVFIVWKNLDKDDDRWLYLPALDLVKRIAATDKRTSFVGSDFFYEDVSGRSINDDTHELQKTTDSYYVLKNTPKSPDTVEFSYFTMWVHRTTFLPLTIEYFDKNGDKYREYKALDVKTIQGHPTVVKARMEDLRTKSSTVLEYSEVAYDIGIPEDVFAERYLRRAPRKYLK